MSKFVIKNPVLLVNSVDLSDRCSQAAVATTFASVDVTTFGDVYSEILQGLGSAQVTLTMFQDFDAGMVDATLWPLSQSGSPFPVTIKPFSGSVSATNPLYAMTGVLLSYNPIDGAVGAASSTAVTIENSSQTGLTRAVS